MCVIMQEVIYEVLVIFFSYDFNFYIKKYIKLLSLFQCFRLVKVIKISVKKIWVLVKEIVSMIVVKLDKLFDFWDIFGVKIEGICLECFLILMCVL